jgi:hypothetical protein
MAIAGNSQETLAAFFHLAMFKRKSAVAISPF